MNKTKLSGLIGIAIVLSAALLIALTAFFGVFDFNRKVNEFVDTLPGNEEDIATPLPDEPETTLPDSPDTPVLPEVPSSEPSFAEAGTSDSSASGLGPAYLNGSAYVESKWSWFDYKFTDASGSSTISLSTLASRYDIAKSKGYLNFQATANVNLNDKGYEQSATANAGGTTSTASGKSGVLYGSTKTIPSSCTSITINWYVQTEDGRSSGFNGPNRAELTNIGVILSKGESTSPSISFESGKDTSAKTITLSDNQSGLYAIYYKFNNGTQKTYSTYTSFQSSVGFNFESTGNGTGKYEIWAEDNLGNVSSHCFVNYCEIDLKLSAYTNGTATTSSDNKTVTTAGGKITTTSTVTGLNSGETATYNVTVNPGYVFVGFNYSTNTESTNSYMTGTALSNFTVTVQNVVSSARSTHSVCGYFIQIGISSPTGAVYNTTEQPATASVSATNITNTKNVAPNGIDTFINTLFPNNVPSSSYFSITYSGTTAGGTTTTAVPKNAGTYKPPVKCTYKNNVYRKYNGAAFKISPMTGYNSPSVRSFSKT